MKSFRLTASCLSLEDQIGQRNSRGCHERDLYQGRKRKSLISCIHLFQSALQSSTMSHGFRVTCENIDDAINKSDHRKIEKNPQLPKFGSPGPRDGQWRARFPFFAKESSRVVLCEQPMRGGFFLFQLTLIEDNRTNEIYGRHVPAPAVNRTN